MEPNEFAKRRLRLLRKMVKNSVAVLPSLPTLLRNDIELPYRQHSDLYYLSQFSEPESVAVLTKLDGKKPFLLFNRERDPEMEIWNGRRAGQDGACSRFGADDAFPIAALDSMLPELFAHCEKIYYAMGAHPHFDSRMLGWIDQLRKKSRAGVHSPLEIVRLDHIVHEMRLLKSKPEIKAMREAAQISAQAHRHAMAVCKPGLTEYQIEAELTKVMHFHGCRRTAYPSIVAGGANACILHYIDNDAVLQDGDLLLIDGGGEFDMYAADITRTFPVNGRFGKYQKLIYELVLAAQQAAIEAVKPGNRWNDPHDRAVEVLTEGMLELGILKGKLKTLLEDQAYKPYYMHRTGHWLGMDVHDVGDYKNGETWRKLEPGMVLTVEPGLYLPAGSKGLAKKWWNIGIRIEDDVLVTKNGYEILSKDAPKSVEAIEHFMGSSRA